MEPAQVLAAYDAEMRRDPIADPGSRVERFGALVRVVGASNYLLYAELNETNARAVVAEQAEFFRRTGQEAEWKVFGHDRQVGLEALLVREGFVPGEPETLVAVELSEGPSSGRLPAGVEVRRATDAAGLNDAVSASVAAFGPDDGRTAARYRAFLEDPNQALFVAYTDGVPVSSGRLELAPGRSFASLWGGGTAPAYRHRGIYRSLVHARAAVARNAGYRYLTVDAEETSRPILERLGFVPLTATRAWTLHPMPANRTARRAPGGSVGGASTWDRSSPTGHAPEGEGRVASRHPGPRLCPNRCSRAGVLGQAGVFSGRSIPGICVAVRAAQKSNQTV